MLLASTKSAHFTMFKPQNNSWKYRKKNAPKVLVYTLSLVYTKDTGLQMYTLMIF